MTNNNTVQREGTGVHFHIEISNFVLTAIIINLEDDFVWNKACKCIFFKDQKHANMVSGCWQVACFFPKENAQ